MRIGLGFKLVLDVQALCWAFKWLYSPHGWFLNQ
jgi:hypothetical protein